MIKLLPSSVINKIAAGEVIERPASVVKELIENAVDAGAQRVDVAIEQGGGELIRVADDGCGIPPDELPLAVTNHATSKIESADDLFRVGTMGFRGEALASIAEVSRFTLRSRTPGATGGAELVVSGGQAEPVAPAGCPVGTTVEVRNLFFNTPVRQKFLRTPQTEIGHCAEAFTRVALAHPERRFSLSHNGRTLHDLPPTDDWRSRIAVLFGQEIADALIAVESEEDGVRLAGYAANPTLSRANNRLQYLLLNGRVIRDRSLQHALGEAYRGLLLTGRYPICFLRLDMPADKVDVNVHPTKLEVRFQDGGRHYSQLLGTLRTKFLTTDLKPVERSSDPTEDEADAGGSSELVNWARTQLTQRRLDASHEGRAPATPSSAPGEPLTLRRFTPAAEAEARSAGNPWRPAGAAAAGYASTEQPQEATSRVDTPHDQTPGGGAPNALQLHNRYLVVETEAGLEIIDQHALHERILYEQIRTKVLAGALEKQKLLVPEPVDLSPSEAAAVLENQSLLADLGIEVEPFGGDTVLVASYPAMLAKLAPAEVLRSVVEQLVGGGKAPDRRDTLDELLHMMSCKAAVKYGDPLTPHEITALLDQRGLTENHHHCPHGRPTALVFTCDELDRRFKRI
ncbi:DNA mismatch repair endonuclease MutL [Posidoniimonas polymericola]|uniref:DNA mismatch repair endonuclease MutL n=1 Tax=Posidoniimonas polymericola TaxID=2528002 RepID=UPI0028F41E7E|nr:DNA mismatch repair endonuclease MutL [Posidoniimonas polymericola]